MSLRVYQPDERWPRHQEGYWNITLDLAREYGWTYAYLDAKHKSGDLICPGGEHTIMVDKTSDGNEAWAVRGRKRITKTCKHVYTKPDEALSSGSQVEARIKTAEGLMNTAEKLIAAASSDLVAIEERHEMEQNLAELDDLRMRLETADQTVAELERLEQMETQWLEDSYALDTSQGTPPSPQAVDAVLEDAATQVNTAAAAMGAVRSHPALDGLRGRIDRARNEIGDLRARLEEFLPESD